MLSSDNKKSLSCGINCKFNLLTACMSLQPGDIMGHEVCPRFNVQ